MVDVCNTLDAKANILHVIHSNCRYIVIYLTSLLTWNDFVNPNLIGLHTYVLFGLVFCSTFLWINEFELVLVVSVPTFYVIISQNLWAFEYFFPWLYGKQCGIIYPLTIGNLLTLKTVRSNYVCKSDVT